MSLYDAATLLLTRIPHKGGRDLWDDVDGIIHGIRLRSPLIVPGFPPQTLLPVVVRPIISTSARRPYRSAKLHLDSGVYSAHPMAWKHLSHLMSELHGLDGMECIWLPCMEMDKSQSTDYTIFGLDGKDATTFRRLGIVNLAAARLGRPTANKVWFNSPHDGAAIRGCVQWETPGDAKHIVSTGLTKVGQNNQYTVCFSRIANHILPTSCTTIAIPIGLNREEETAACTARIDEILAAYAPTATVPASVSDTRCSRHGEYLLCDPSDFQIMYALCTCPILDNNKFFRPVFALNAHPWNFSSSAWSQYNAIRRREYTQRVREAPRPVGPVVLGPFSDTGLGVPARKKAEEACLPVERASEDEILRVQILALQRKLSRLDGDDESDPIVQKVRKRIADATERRQQLLAQAGSDGTNKRDGGELAPDAGQAEGEMSKTHNASA